MSRLAPLVVGCAADARYALPLAVMLRSAAANLDPQRELQVYVVDGGLDAEARARVARSLPEGVVLHWVAPQRAGFTDLPLWGRMPITTYDKLMIDRWLPPSVTQALWLDCDLLVLGDLARLWALGTGGRHALAAQDQLVPTVASRFGIACHAELGIDPTAKYFNAGVMLIDVARWRDDDVAGRALAYLERHRERVYFWDQEALNVALAGRWGTFDPRWNWNPTIGRFAAGAAQAEAPWILHFSGALKPWRFAAKSPAHELYYRYLDLTAWTGWRPSRSWTSMALGFYESSGLRRIALPFEPWGMALLRAMTLHYASARTARGDGADARLTP